MSKFYIQLEGKEVGPLSADELKSAAKRGKITKDTLIRKAESKNWHSANEVKGLFLVKQDNPMITKSTIITKAVPQNFDVECHFCGETIKQFAKKCKHCGEILDSTLAEIKKSTSSNIPPAIQIVNTNTIGVAANVATFKRWNRLAAILLSLIIPGLGQIYKGQMINGIAWFMLCVLGYVCFIVPGVVLHIFCIIGASLGDPYKAN